MPPETIVLLAESWIDRGKFDDALRTSDEAIEKAEGMYIGGCAIKTTALVSLGRLEEAKEVIQQAERRATRVDSILDGRTQYYLARACAAIGNGSEALRHLRAAVGKEPFVAISASSDKDKEF